MKIIQICLGILLSILLFAGCKKDKQTTNTNTHPRLIFKFVYDSTQVRLNNFGQPDSTMPANHAGQNPHMNFMSAHYIELAPNAYTQLGTGVVLYVTPTTTAGGDTAIDFSKEVLTPNGGTVYSVALDSVAPGTYDFLRVSLAYQNFGVQLYEDTTIDTSYGGQPVSIPIVASLPCTVASFVGYNTYISSYNVGAAYIAVNGSRRQGYWGFESNGSIPITVYGQTFNYPYHFLTSGQAPVGATTVVNPLFNSSPIPAGSCLATGAFVSNTVTGPQKPLTITGHETADIIVTVSLSVNHSFEWIEVVHDGKWQPSKGETIVDMGIRGLIPIISQ